MFYYADDYMYKSRHMINDILRLKYYMLRGPTVFILILGLYCPFTTKTPILIKNTFLKLSITQVEFTLSLLLSLTTYTE